MNENKNNELTSSYKSMVSTQSELDDLPQDTDSKHFDGGPIAKTVENYFSAIMGIVMTGRVALTHMSKWQVTELEKAQKKIEKFLPEQPDDERRTFTPESARDFAEFSKTIEDFKGLSSHNFSAIIAKSLFTQLFSEFDSYVGDLLKIIYLRNDKLLKGVSREISPSDLLEFEDPNTVKLSMLDKEIETFRRDSYIEQFNTLEKKFKLQLKQFKDWPLFVELSQRRNILIHNGGLVSEQYLIVCDREAHKFASKPSVGQLLEVDPEYFLTAARLLSKVGLMLAYTLWSKVFPHENEVMHKALNDTLYACLEKKRWQLVSELEEFVLSAPMRKDISESDLKIRIINVGIGLKFSKKDVEVERLLSTVDWSASYRDFKLAIAVLLENYNEALGIMKSIGKAGEILDQYAYHSWPLFLRFREHPEFYDAYYSIYGEAFSEKVNTAKGSVEAQAKPPAPTNSDIAMGNVIDGVAHEILSGNTEGGNDAPVEKIKKSKSRVPKNAKSSTPGLKRSR